MNDYPVLLGELEVRVEGDGRVLSATFPYNRMATVASAGSTRKEMFESGSLSWQTREFAKLQAELQATLNAGMAEARRRALVERLEDALEKRNTHLLHGHSFDRPLADTLSGTLYVEHTREAVLLRANLPPEGQAPSWVEDAVKGVRGGQIRGVSPAFNVPPGQGRERLEREPGGPSMVRILEDVVAYEYSLTSRPAYSGTTVDAREDDLALPTVGRRRFWL